MITYVKHTEIDKYKWDICIHKSANALVFAYSWYLDCVCDSWDALIKGDYEYVFAITRKSKFNIHYFFNPLLAFQLGIFSEKLISPAITEEFLNHLPPKIKLINIQLNFGNPYEGKKFEITSKKCQFINLQQSYVTITQKYSTNLSRNIQKAKKAEINIINTLNADHVVRIFRENRGNLLNEFKAPDFINLSKVISAIVNQEKGKIFEAYYKETLVAAACFSYSDKRIVFIKGGSTQKGRELNAMHLIIDRVLYENAGKEWIFDFSGSSVEQVARFNYGFGAVDYEYCRLYKNNLPFYMKLFKK